MKIIKDKRALSLARRHRPLIIQGYDHPVDIPSKIEFGEFKPVSKPVVYYWVRCDKDFYYIGYALYHYADYTKCVFAKILGLGEHRHDFEGILVRVPYYKPHHKAKGCGDIITVAHHDFHYDEDNDVVSVEARGHGIYPEEYWLTSKMGNSLCIDSPRHISLDNFSRSQWDITKHEFNNHNVNMPDQWSHRGKYKGWMWNHPDKLFKELENG